MIHNYFRLNDGRLVKHYSELPEVLESMDKDTFSLYVSAFKNDFSKWVFDIFGEEDLSKKIGAVKSKEDMARIINAHLIPLSNAEVKFKFKENPKKELPVTEPINSEKKEEKPMIISPIEEFVSPEVKKIEVDIATNRPADNFFKENPVLVSQMIESKKSKIDIEPLTPLLFTGKESALQLVDLFKDTYAKIYDRMQFIRKSGFDTDIIEMMVIRIPPKIKLFEISQDEKDKLIIKRYINEAIEELNGVK